MLFLYYVKQKKPIGVRPILLAYWEKGRTEVNQFGYELNLFRSRLNRL